MLLIYKDIATFIAGSHISRIQQSDHGELPFFMPLNTFWQMIGSTAKISVDMLIRDYKLFKEKQAAMLAENPNYKPLKVATIFTYAANEVDKSDKEAVNGLLDEEDISLPHGAKIDTSSRDHLDSFIKDYNELYGTSYSANDS